MAVTNITNLDGLDAVTNVAAGGETYIKDAIKSLMHGINDERMFDLFIGQMAAEGFATTVPGALRATLESPTVKITFTVQTGFTRMNLSFLVSSAWQTVMERSYPGTF